MLTCMQMKPDSIIDKISTTQNESFRSNPFQVWQISGSCPQGTVPIRRIRGQDLLRTNSLHNFGKKFSYGSIKLEINPSVSKNLISMGFSLLGSKFQLINLLLNCFNLVLNMIRRGSWSQQGSTTLVLQEILIFGTLKLICQMTSRLRKRGWKMVLMKILRA